MPDVFISYSRKNLEFVQQLVDALEHNSKECWFDKKKEPLEGIIEGAPWWDQIKYGIETADNFLFVISPDAIASPYCHAELNHARQHGKRLVTILHCGDHSEQDTWDAISAALDAIPPDALIPDEVTREPLNFQFLARQNWLSLNEIQYVLFTAAIPFQDAYRLLVNALDLDMAWNKLRNRVRQAALLWESSGRSEGYLWSDEQLRPVYEMSARHVAEWTDVECDFIRTEVERLVEKLERDDLDHAARAGIGERLHIIGDTRPGVGLRDDGLPDIVWCQVGDGQIIDAPLFKSTYPVQTPFFVSKYLVTYQQYQAFLDAEDGMHNAAWETDFNFKQDRRSMTLRDQRFKLSNNPRESVGWYDAIAFCRWLSAHLGYDITLPSELQWYAAATLGDTSLRYPWTSDKWRGEGTFANTLESGLQRTIAVGMYPHGMSPCGAMDMAGNVWEWCLNDALDPDKVQIGGDQSRAMRGGSWREAYRYATCNSRASKRPHDRITTYGFRLCCTNPLPADHE